MRERKHKIASCSYSLHEHTRVKIMKKAIPKKLTKELICAFEATSNRGTINVKASKLENAVHNIAVQKVLTEQSIEREKRDCW